VHLVGFTVDGTVTADASLLCGKAAMFSGTR